MRFALFILLACLFLTRTSMREARADKAQITRTTPQARQLLATSSRRVAEALWRNDTRTLAQFVHPKQGIRFSPYVFLDVKAARVWSRIEVERAKQNRQRYLWGQHDGTGQPIRLTWNEFRGKFLSPRDFSRKARMTFLPKRSRGNTVNNLRQVYPGATTIEFYLPGSRQYSGMDWYSLWQVWRPIGGRWYLVAITGDRWTT